MAVQVGAQYLEAPNGGRGMLLGGVPGVAPGERRHHRRRRRGTQRGEDGASASGAHVTIIDRNLNRLRELDDIYSTARWSRWRRTSGPSARIVTTADLVDRRGADPRRVGAEAGAARDDRRR